MIIPSRVFMKSIGELTKIRSSASLIAYWKHLNDVLTTSVDLVKTYALVRPMLVAELFLFFHMYY